MKSPWILLLILPLFVLGSCAPSQRGIEVFPSLTPSNTVKIAPVTMSTTPAAVPTLVAAGGWDVYHNSQAGYSADYPAEWTVNESIGINSGIITTFLSPDAGQGIVVSVLNSDAILEEIPDMPNLRCQQITVSGISARRCLDTIAQSLSTTLLAPGRQYSITSFGKHADQNIYQLFLESFTVTP